MYVRGKNNGNNRIPNIIVMSTEDDLKPINNFTGFELTL